MSPVSIAAALGMAAGGARSETAAEMKRVLHLQELSAAVTFGLLLADVQSRAHLVTIRATNRLFGDKGYVFDEEYLERTRAAFGAPLEPLDFRGAPEEARLFINGWIARETEDRIKDFLPGGSVNSETRLVLTNAIYFLGDWEKPFEKRKTSEAPFHATSKESRAAPTMHELDHFSFAAMHGVKAIEMPYVGGAVSMTLVLPDKMDGLAELERTIAPALFDQLTTALKAELCAVSLPKFEVDPAEPMSVIEELKSLGMQDAFNREKADFTGMGRPTEPNERFFMNQVFHKAFVKLDEKGTEAAATSAANMALASAPSPGDKPLEFRADHPFLFFLRDRRTSLILFMGRVAAPTAG
jgi:serpin B